MIDCRDPLAPDDGYDELIPCTECTAEVRRCDVDENGMCPRCCREFVDGHTTEL